MVAGSVSFEFGGYLHDADDLDDFVTFRRRSPTAQRTPQGAVYITAAGTRRWTRSPGVAESFQLTVRTNDAAVHEWINRRDGELVLYKDQRSRREYGIITDVSVQDMHNGIFDIAMDFSPVDHVVEPVQGGG